MAKVQYIGAILTTESVWKLLEAFPPKHGEVHAHHCTLVFRPDREELEWWACFVGDEVNLIVEGEASDENGHAVLVTNMVQRSKNLHPHITVSTAPGVRPVYSNTLLADEKSETTWNYRAPLLLRAVIDTYPSCL